jgi:hypothetical protein
MFYLTSIMTKLWFCELRFVWDGHWIWKWDSSYMGFWGCSGWNMQLVMVFRAVLWNHVCTTGFFQVLECLSELKFLFELHLCSVSCNVVHNFDVAFRIWASQVGFKIKIRLSILKIIWLLVRLSIFLGNNDVYAGYQIIGW